LALLAWAVADAGGFIGRNLVGYGSPGEPR
jgi:hypothetical protein